MEITNTLKKLLSQDRNSLHREGALLAMEMLCTIVGKLFEPYVVQLLPDLLSTFGDKNEGVRRAADDTARAVMKALSAHGVKLEQCPTVPKQLRRACPAILPKLCDYSVDTHSKVQKAGEKALKQIAQVIQNPEIMSISLILDQPIKPSLLLKSSSIPDSSIIRLTFTCPDDAHHSQSLRIGTLRRENGHTNIANIYSLADPKDMEPYLRELVPGLKKTITDPAPGISTNSCIKSFGSIIRYSSSSTSETLQSDIMPWLKESCLKDQHGDRSGAAQCFLKSLELWRRLSGRICLCYQDH
uniref:TOG domain-containing protein n=1 Tax=Ditylenchus dipsaci TaxID=166011 RepID=A0A915EWB0_9BILA